MQPAAHLRWVDIDGEILVLELDTGALHLLDRPAAAVWRRLDGSTALADVARGVADEFGADLERVERDLASLAETLRARGLVHSERLPDGHQTNLDATGAP